MFNLAEYLTKCGHQICFFGMDDPRNIVNISKKMLVTNVDFHKKTWRRWLYPFKIIYSLESRIKLATILNEFQPDIVHLNNYNFQITPSIIYELKKRKIPIVQTLHDLALICPAHSLYNSKSGELCERCKGRKYTNCIIKKCIHGSLVKSLLGAIEGYLYYKIRTYDYIRLFICPSNFLANKLMEFGVGGERLRVIHNFVMPCDINEGISRGDYFLYIGRLSQEKGLLTLIDAVQRLPQINFVIAGNGPLEYKLSKYPNLKYVGFQQGKALNILIKNSIAVICPSELYENCPLSVLESQNLGTPVIATDIGGIPELIEDGVDGFLFKPGDLTDLVNKILCLHTDQELRKRFSVKCQFKIQNYSVDKYYHKLMEIYQLAIESTMKTNLR